MAKHTFEKFKFYHAVFLYKMKLIINKDLPRTLKAWDGIKTLD